MKHLALIAAALAATPAAAQSAGDGAFGVTPAFNVSNLANEVKFYTEGLGLKVLMQMGQPKRYETMLGYAGSPPSVALILMSDQTAKDVPPKTHGTGFDRLVVRVKDLEAVVARLRKLGFTASDIRGSSLAPSKVAIATDPEGFRLELVQVTGAMPAKPASGQPSAKGN